MPARVEPTFSALISSDIARYTGREGPWWTAVPRGFSRPGLWASLVVRAQERLHARGLTRLASLLRGVGVATIGIDVAAGARIGPGVWFEHPVGVVIGNGVVVGARATIAQGVTLGVRDSFAQGGAGFPVLGDDVFVGSRASVLGGVTIGDGAKVAAHALVLDDVDARTTVVGVPARPVSPAA